MSLTTVKSEAGGSPRGDTPVITRRERTQPNIIRNRLRPILFTKVPRAKTTCSGGIWNYANDIAIDSGCTLNLVTKTEAYVSNNDVDGGLTLLTASGDTTKADGRGETYFQTLAQNVETGERLIHRSCTGQGGTTHVRNSKQDLMSSSFMSRNGMIPVQDHDNPRCILRGRPGFEITCTEVQNLWYLPLCIWGEGCNKCEKCREVRSKSCWNTDGRLEDFVQVDNVRFAPLPVRHRPTGLHVTDSGVHECDDTCNDLYWIKDRQVARRTRRGHLPFDELNCTFLTFFGEENQYKSIAEASAAHLANIKRMRANDKFKERRATTSDNVPTHLGRKLVIEEFGDLMTELARERVLAVSRSSSEEGSSSKTTSNRSSTQPRMSIHGDIGANTTPSVLDDITEQESRVQAQARLGIRPRATKQPRVPAKGGQVPLAMAHNRLGHTSTRVLKATSACVKNFTLTHENWNHCDCTTCMRNKTMRPMQSSAARTPRDHEAVIRPFSRLTMDFKGKIRQESWNGYSWFLTIVCKETDAIYPGFSGRKSDAPKLFKEFIKWTKSKKFMVKLLSSDSDTCFLSAEFRKILEEENIEQRLYLRSHRGDHAERSILTTLRRASAILIHSMLSPIMWADAMLFSVMIHNRLCNPDHWRRENRVKTRLELCTGEIPDFKELRTPLCTVFVMEHGARYGQFKPKVLPGSWVNLGPSEIVAGAVRCFDTVTRKVIVSSHVWFQESMKPRLEALTNFDMNMFPNLKRLSNGKTRVLMTKEERQAFKLRELYCDPKSVPQGTVVIEGDLLTEYRSPLLPEAEPFFEEYPQTKNLVESEGYADWDEIFDDNKAKRNGTRGGNSEVQNHSNDESHGIYSDNVDIQAEDPQSLFESDDDVEDEDLEDKMASTDEEYKELVQVKNHKLQPKMSDSEVRQAAEQNVANKVHLEMNDAVQDEDGVTVKKFLQQTDCTLPRSQPDVSSRDLDNQKKRRRSKSRANTDLTDDEKRSIKEKLESIPLGKHSLTNQEKTCLRHAYVNDLDIIWLTKENPKQRKSRDKFARYWNDGKNRITEAKKNGMSWADYQWDFEKGFFRLDPKALDKEPALVAALASPATEAVDTLTEPSLAGALLDAPIFAPGTRVILKDMDKSRYRNLDYNGRTGQVLKYDDNTRRFLVKPQGQGLLYVRGINLDEDVTHHPTFTAYESAKAKEKTPPPQLVALLGLQKKTQELHDRTKVAREIQERVRMLNLELAEPEPLTTLKLYDMMAEAYKLSIQKAYEVYCPKDVKTATTCKDRVEWIKSMRKEINDLVAMKTWTVVPRSTAKKEGKNVMKSGMIYKVKSDDDGFFTKRKSRFVCKGYSEVYGQDYYNVRSGVVDYSSARMLIALAAAERAELWTYDVKNAFVSTTVPPGEEFYCDAPQDVYGNELYGDMFDLPDGSRGILRCSRCLYGSKNSPRRFWQKLQKTLQMGGFSTTVQDQCVLVCNRTGKGGGILRVAMWVDDLLVTTTNDADKIWFDNLLKDSFELSEDSGVEPAQHYLGMKVTRDNDKRTITLSTPALIESMIKDLEEGGHIKSDATVKQHPMSGTKLEGLVDKGEGLNDTDYPYRTVVGICLHLSRTTRPDIALAVSELSRFVTCYGPHHVKAANWLALYLKGTANIGVTYHGDLHDHLRNKLISFSDADWAGDTVTRKSRSGYTLQLNLGPIEWYSKGQTITSTSSCMSETIAAVEAAKAIVSMRLLLYELGYEQPGSSRLYVDNEATVLNANGTNQSKRSKHFQIRTELLRVYTDLGRIHVFKVHTNLNISDLHTKALLGDKFIDMRDIMMGTKADLDILHYS